MKKITCPLLYEVFDSNRCYDNKGIQHTFTGGIPIDYAEALYSYVKKTKPENVIEIGMAYGISSLAILAALNEIGSGHLISIDPCQFSSFNGIGLENVKRAGFADKHTLLNSFDYVALPKLVSNDHKISFAYIDGWHTFDYCLLDFFFIDKMLEPNGVVAFNDCGWRAVHKTIKFMQKHRRYLEIDSELKPDYSASNIIFEFVKKMSGRNNCDRYFKKLECWEPERADFFKYF